MVTDRRSSRSALWSGLTHGRKRLTTVGDIFSTRKVALRWILRAPLMNFAIFSTERYNLSSIQKYLQLWVTLVKGALSRDLVDNDEIEDLDESFVGHFLINGSVRQPIESMMIPTASIQKLTENIRNNKTYCFKTDPGPFGWCATCKGMI